MARDFFLSGLGGGGYPATVAPFHMGGGESIAGRPNPGDFLPSGAFGKTGSPVIPPSELPAGLNSKRVGFLLLDVIDKRENLQLKYVYYPMCIMCIVHKK